MNGYDDPFDRPESDEWRGRQRKRFVWIVGALIALVVAVLAYGLSTG